MWNIIWVHKINHDMNTGNVHRESRNTQNWFRYENFNYLFEFKFFRHEERQSQLLQQTRGTFPRPPSWSRLGETKNCLPSSSVESQLSVFFFQIPKSSALPGMTSFTSPVISYLGLLLWHRWLSHPPRTRVNTCAQCVHLTNPCTNRKVLSLTKPKGKIYKTKSLRNCITHV